MSAPHRWRWLYRFARAALHIVRQTYAPRGPFAFTDLAHAYLSTVSHALDRARPCLPRLQPDPKSLRQHLPYLYQLEAELWGPEGEAYRHENTAPAQPFLRTFHLPLAFFLMERWLNAAWPREQHMGRGAQRRRLFGLKDGVFARRCPAAWDALGLPFAVRANTRRVLPPEPLQVDWDHLDAEAARIVAAALVRTRQKLPTKIRGWPRRVQGAAAWWYDVWWVYSESLRYHPLEVTFTPDEVVVWNRALRWLTSLWILGLGQVLYHALPPEDRPLLRTAWHTMHTAQPVLAAVYDHLEPFL